MGRYQFVVMSDPAEGQEAEYNRWYDEQHVPDMLAIPGILSAKRSKFVQGKTPPAQRYMTIYDVETDDLAALFADIGARAGTDRLLMSPALDANSVTTTVFELSASVPA